jgi:hypothetical protein
MLLSGEAARVAALRARGHDSRTTRRLERRRRRRVALLAALGLLVAGMAGAAIWASGRAGSDAAAPLTPVVRLQDAAPRLHPPGPIPGYLLIADRGNNRMLLVDSAKHVYWTYPPRDITAAMPFRFDDDAFFGPSLDRVVSNQEEQHTIQVVSFPGGRILWRYGHVGIKGSAAGYLDTPDDAYLLRNGLVSVADASNCRVLFIDRAHRIVRAYGRAGDCRHDPPTALGAVNGATPLRDGGTLVSEISGSWIDDIGPGGRVRWAVQAPVSYPSDPQLLGPGRILLADYARPGHVLIMTSGGRVLWRYGPASGPGELDHPSLAFRIAPGLIAVTDDYRDRVVVISVRLHRIVWQYGVTDRPGRGANHLNTPDGLDLLTTAEAQRVPALRNLLVERRPATGSPRLLASAGYRLRAPIQREVAVADRGSIVIAGGLAASGSSSSGVFRLHPESGRLTLLGTVSKPFHDAGGAIVQNRLLVFGGGAAQSSSAVQSFDLVGRRGAVIGHLPRPLSDLAAATIGATVYLVGGYDGTRPRREVYGTTSGRSFRLVGRLPQGLRYPAVAAAGDRLVIAGGVGVAGPTGAVFALDPATGRVRRLGQLPVPVGHAVAVPIGGSVYVAGGVDAAGNTSSAIVRIDPVRGTVTTLQGSAGISDAGAAVVGGRAYVIGGARGDHATADVRVLRLGPRRR